MVYWSRVLVVWYFLDIDGVVWYGFSNLCFILYINFLVMYINKFSYIVVYDIILNEFKNKIVSGFYFVVL